MQQYASDYIQPVSKPKEKIDFKPLLNSTKKIFASYCQSKTKVEKFKFHEYFSKFGVVNELIVHTPSRVRNFLCDETSNNNQLFSGFAFVYFIDVESVNKCFENGGSVHTIDGVTVHFRRIISMESVVKRKRDLHIEEYYNTKLEKNNLPPSFSSGSASNIIPLNSNLSNPSLVATSLGSFFSGERKMFTTSQRSQRPVRVADDVDYEVIKANFK